MKNLLQYELILRQQFSNLNIQIALLSKLQTNAVFSKKYIR